MPGAAGQQSDRHQHDDGVRRRFSAERGVAYLVTTTPRLEGRSFGTNVLEAMLIALAGTGRALTSEELGAMLTQLHIQPSITPLQRQP